MDAETILELEHIESLQELYPVGPLRDEPGPESFAANS